MLTHAEMVRIEALKIAVMARGRAGQLTEGESASVFYDGVRRDAEYLETLITLANEDLDYRERGIVEVPADQVEFDGKIIERKADDGTYFAAGRWDAEGNVEMYPLYYDGPAGVRRVFDLLHGFYAMGGWLGLDEIASWPAAERKAVSEYVMASSAAMTGVSHPVNVPAEPEVFKQAMARLSAEAAL